MLGHGYDKFEEEKDDMQIDSSSGPKNKKWNNDPQLFENNAAKYRLRDKVIIFGGWQPYENLREVEAFDAKTNEVEDIVPLALGMRGKHYEAKKSILSRQQVSASTAHESNSSDDLGSDSAYSDDDGNLDIMEEDRLDDVATPREVLDRI